MQNDTTDSVKSTLNNGTPQPPGSAPQTVNTYPYSDAYNAQALAQDHGQDLRYCHRWGKWLVWSETRWAFDPSEEVMRRARHTIDTLKRLIPTLSVEESNILRKHIRTSLSHRGLKAMVALAQSEHPFPIEPDMLDKDPMLFNCLNGTLDLRTGKLRAHQREDYIERVAKLF